MTTPLVECEGLVKIYQVPEAGVEVVALQGLDLEVRAGEMLAIVGRSGSGKSTLLNILGGLDLPSAGQCQVAGHLLTRLSERERNDYRRFVVGHVWQQSGRNLVADLTLLENVGLPQLLARVPARARRARALGLLRAVGLATQARKRPDQLSGGEQQRGAIAVALANAPRLLLADEPTGELDSATARAIVALLRTLTDTVGLTIILVTHDPVIAATADRTIVIRDGRTSAESVRRVPLPDAPNAPDAPDERVSVASPSLSDGMPVLVNRAGWLQLPDAVARAMPLDGRAALRIAADHVQLWPVGTLDPHADGAAPTSSLLDMPLADARQVVIIDAAGRLQLPESALHRIPFGRHAAVRAEGDHIEIRPLGRTGESREGGV